MMLYRVTLNNSAGELAHHDVRLYPVKDEGLPYGMLIEAIRALLDGAPTHDGDSITITKVK